MRYCINLLAEDLLPTSCSMNALVPILVIIFRLSVGIVQCKFIFMSVFHSSCTLTWDTVVSLMCDYIHCLKIESHDYSTNSKQDDILWLLF